MHIFLQYSVILDQKVQLKYSQPCVNSDFKVGDSLHFKIESWDCPRDLYVQNLRGEGFTNNFLMLSVEKS